MFLFPNYKPYFAPATKTSTKGRASGGVLVLVKNSLNHYVKDVKCTIDNAVCLLFTNNTLDDSRTEEKTTQIQICPDNNKNSKRNRVAETESETKRER